MFEQIVSFFQISGWTMYGIVLCSILALAVFLERLAALRRTLVVPEGFAVEVEELVRQKRIVDAITLCKKQPSPLARIVYAGLSHAGRHRERIKEVVVEVGARENIKLERYIPILNTTISVAPMLGFLGTVLGMVQLFSNVAASGEVTNIGLIADGIYKALYTTIAGLTVAIPATVFYRYLDSRLNRLVVEMEEVALRIVDLIKEN